MSEEPANYYDEVYKRPDTVYQKNYSESGSVFKYNDLTLDALQKAGKNAIIEIGAGMGHLIDMALSTTDLEGYIGLDFSNVGLARCNEIVIKSDKKLKEFELLQCDFNKIKKLPVFKSESLKPLYVSHETLEHFEKDLECIALIPVGEMVAISVPNFGGKGHVRFGNAEYWTNRYKGFLRYSKCVTMGSTGKEHIWILAKRNK